MAWEPTKVSLLWYERLTVERCIYVSELLHSRPKPPVAFIRVIRRSRASGRGTLTRSANRLRGEPLSRS